MHKLKIHNLMIFLETNHSKSIFILYMEIDQILILRDSVLYIYDER